MSSYINCMLFYLILCHLKTILCYFIIIYFMSSYNNFMLCLLDSVYDYIECNVFIPLESTDHWSQLTAHGVILIKPHSLIWFWVSIQDQ